MSVPWRGAELPVAGRRPWHEAVILARRRPRWYSPGGSRDLRLSGVLSGDCGSGIRG